MATQTRQQMSGRTIGLWRIVGVTVGIVAVSVALIGGGMEWQRITAPQAESVAQAVVAQHAPLGIALPHGADFRELPAGLKDYIRAGEQPATAALEQHPLGIGLPLGANPAELPSGLTDYLRPGNAAVRMGIRAAPGLASSGSAYDGQPYAVRRYTVV